jgi:hypothetical protein
LEVENGKHQGFIQYRIKAYTLAVVEPHPGSIELCAYPSIEKAGAVGESIQYFYRTYHFLQFALSGVSLGVETIFTKYGYAYL